MQVTDIRGLSVFDGLSDEQLGALVAVGDQVMIEPGVELTDRGPTQVAGRAGAKVTDPYPRAGRTSPGSARPRDSLARRCRPSTSHPGE